LSASVPDLVVSQLTAAGVRALFGVPGGGTNLDLMDAARRAGLPFVLSQTETAGALMACAQAELTSRPGACLCTLGPGAASIVNGVAHASLDRVPLIVFTDRHPESADAFLHQRLDHAALLAPMAKHSLRLQADTDEAEIARAIACALDSPRGPVHVDCGAVTGPRTSRVQRTSSGLRTGNTGRPESTLDVGLRTPDVVRKLVTSSTRPLIIAGLGAADPEVARAVRAFCEQHAIPALVTYKAKGVVPDHSPLFAGIFTNGAIERSMTEQADLLIGVGLDPVELLPRAWSFAAPVIGLGVPIPGQRHVPFAAEIAGSIPDALNQLCHARNRTTGWAPADVRRAADAQRAAVRVDGARLSPSRAIAMSAEAVGTGARVTVDAGAHMLPALALWPVDEPRQLLISNGLSTMGFALPSAIGASLIDRDRRVVALTGDGGLLMCLGELKTAVRERARVLTIVLNDSALSLIKIKQDRRALASQGVELGAVDWCAVAGGMGMPAWRADDERSLERALGAALAVDGPALLDVRVDPGVYPATLAAVRG
jgi:acetolactate synthase-1/2/3 large subunit